MADVMLWIAGAAAIFCSLFWIMPVYMVPPKGLSYGKQLAVKAIPTVLAALFGGAALAASGFGDRYALLVFIALCVCAAADVMLGLKFIVGGALFFAGHMLYIAALSGMGGLHQAGAWVFLTAFVLLLVFLRRYFHLFPSKWLFAGVAVYCTALGALLAFSLPAAFAAPARRSVLAALGALLFVLSDMGTCHAMLTDASPRFNRISLGVYYTAQFLLGMSAFA